MFLLEEYPPQQPTERERLSWFLLLHLCHNSSRFFPMIWGIACCFDLALLETDCQFSCPFLPIWDGNGNKNQNWQCILNPGPGRNGVYLSLSFYFSVCWNNSNSSLEKHRAGSLWRGLHSWIRRWALLLLLFLLLLQNWLGKVLQGSVPPACYSWLALLPKGYRQLIYYRRRHMSHCKMGK